VDFLDGRDRVVGHVVQEEAEALARELGAIIGVETRALWLAGAVEQSPRNQE
jgi:hypothetical protein